jgi:HD-GYP domain-containing protein (c-di-GMP phosphodiesterase class II)
VSVPRAGEPLFRKLRRHDPLEPRSRQAKDGFLLMYDEAAVGAQALFRAFQAGQEVDAEELGRLARQLVGGLIEDRDLLLNLSSLRPDSDYLVTHCLAVAALAIAAGSVRGHNRRLVLELAHAALCHDLGMLRVPEEIRRRAGPLAPAELLEVRRHPLHSLVMLQRLAGSRGALPFSVPVVAYQAHEREDGSGYPRGRRGRFIHEFAKIVAVCDVYQALASPRPWRAALLPYQAMEQIVRMGGRRELDPQAVRALLGCLSLFPVGSWVELADGSRGRVVAPGGRDCARPVVSLLERKGARLAAPLRVNLAEHRELKVARPLAPPDDALDAMEGF